MADLLDRLLANSGTYVGSQADPGDTSGRPPTVARINVSPLPGNAGVAFDYEVLDADGSRPHHDRHQPVIDNVRRDAAKEEAYDETPGMAAEYR